MKPFWNDEFKTLDYEREPFNDPESLSKWRLQGYEHTYFTGEMCDMRKEQPLWNDKIIKFFNGELDDGSDVIACFTPGNQDWNDVCTSYYRMTTGNILPMHRDLYERYKQIFDLHHGQTLWRCLIFLEDRKEGHILEVENEVIDWKAGDYVVWTNDVKHAAANIGIEDRYTLQVTGWTK